MNTALQTLAMLAVLLPPLSAVGKVLLIRLVS